MGSALGSNLRIRKIRLQIIFLYSLAFVFLLWGYRDFVVPVCAYSGFLWEPDLFKIYEGLLLTLIVAVILPDKFKKSSDILIHIQFLFPILPMLVLYGSQDGPRVYVYITLLAFMTIYLLATYVKLKPVKISRINIVLYQKILLFAGWAVIAVIILLGGWRYFNLNIWRVYEFRSAAASNLPSFFGYINPAVSKVIFPFSLLLAVVNRERLFALFSLLGSILMFGLTAHKGALFYPFAVMALYYILNRKNIFLWLFGGYSGLIIMSVFLYVWKGVIGFGSLMLRRVCFDAANTNYHYFDFFSTHPFTWWAESKVTFRLLDYKYSLSVPHLIGMVYYNSPSMDANTGWIGSGYSAAGYVGMFISAAIIGVFLAVVNAYGKNINPRLIVAILTAPFLAVFMSSDIFTAMLTHGSLYGLLLLMFMPRLHKVGNV